MSSPKRFGTIALRVKAGKPSDICACIKVSVSYLPVCRILTWPYMETMMSLMDKGRAVVTGMRTE